MPVPGQLSPLDLITSVGKANPVAEQQKLASLNWLAQSFDIFAASANTVAATSQVIHAVGIPLIAGQVVTNVLMANGLAASGTLPTSVEVGLVTPDLKVAAKSANTFTATANWPLGVVATPLSAAYTTTQSGVHYVYYLTNGNFGTNIPVFVKSAASAILTAGQSYFGNFGTGQTTIPAVGSAVGTFSAASGPCFWFGVN